MKNKILYLSITIFLFFLIFVNFYYQIFRPSPVLRAKLMMISLSRGDRYFGRLNLWYLYARAGNWASAASLEPLLDPVDIALYKSTHQPSELKKYINQLTVKTDKSTDDWIELARIQNILGKSALARESLLKAQALDPIRDDITSLYYLLSK